MTDWFRMWHGAPSDPKWRLIAKRARVRPGDVWAVVSYLFDRASKAEDRGSVAGFDCELIADVFGYEIDEVERIMAELSAKGVVEADRLTAWDKYQPKREDGSAERAKAFRTRQKEETERTQTQPNATERNRPLEESRVDTEKNAATQQRAREPMLLDKLLDARGLTIADLSPVSKLREIEDIRDLIGKGYTLEADILPVIRDQHASGKAFQSWRFITPIVIERANKRNAIPTKPPAASEDWAGRIAAWRKDRTWGAWGPRPGERGCRVPADLLTAPDEKANAA